MDYKVVIFGKIIHYKTHTMKGKTLRTFFRFLFVSGSILCYTNLFAQSVVINTFPNTSQNIFTGNSGYHVGEIIYLDSEIGSSNFTTAGTAIDRISLSINVVGAPTSFGNFSVYYKQVPVDTVSFAAKVWDKTGFTQVYTGTIDVTATGLFNIDLTTPIVRTSGQNLVIMFERLDGVARTSPFTYDASQGNSSGSTVISTRRYNGTTPPVAGTTNLTSLSAFRPQITFTHKSSADVSAGGLVLPSPSCLNTVSIPVTLTNNGSAPISPLGATVNLTISGANTYTGSLSNITTIAPGGNVVLTFTGINVSTPGTNTVQALASTIGDGNATNDTAKGGFITTTTTTSFPITETTENTPLDYFSYLKTLSGSQAWAISTAGVKYKNVDLSDSLGAHGGGRFYYFNSWNFSNANGVLYSNCLSLPSPAPGFVYNVNFWMSHDSSYFDALDSMYLVVSTDKGATWIRKAGFQRYDATFTIPGWKQETVDLASYAGQTIHIGFEGVSKFGNVIGLDDITVNAGAILPVTLLNFSGIQTENGNQLIWKTATEINNKGFELQRSVDGINYTKLGFVKTLSETGNSSRILNYSFTDVNPLTSTNYYRLKQIDKDGRSNVSNVVIIKGTKSNSLRIAAAYPNPAVQVVNLIVSSPNSEKVNLVITDLAGKLIKQSVTQINNGDNNIQVNVEGIAKGTYTLKMIGNSGNVSNNVKFIKQ